MFPVGLVGDLSANEYLVGGRLTVAGQLKSMLSDYIAPPTTKVHIVPDIRGFTSELKSLFGRQVIYIEKLFLEKNTVLDESIVKKLFIKYEKRKVTIQEFNQLIAELNMMYLDQGYIYSGVVIPHQSINAGEIRLLAVESKVSQIEIVGHANHHERYIRNLLLKQLKSPLNKQELEIQLDSMQRQLNLKHSTMSLFPGIHLGEAQLKLVIEEQASERVFLGIDNRRSTATEDARLFLRYGYYNFSGWGESFDVEWGVNEKFSDYVMSYSVPLFNSAVNFSSYFVRSDEYIIERSIDTLASNTYLSGVQLRSKIVANRHLVFQPTIGIEYKDNTTSFYENLSDTLSLATHLIKVGSSFELINVKHQFAGRLMNYSGVERIDRNNEGFFSLLSADIQYWYTLSKDIFSIKSSAQYGLSELPYTYQFIMGSSQSFWGYGNDVVARDHGAIISMEYDYRLATSNGYKMWLQPVFRMAKLGNKSQAGVFRASAGLSYKWTQHDKWQVSLTYMIPLQQDEVLNRTITRSNVNFSMMYRMY